MTYIPEVAQRATSGMRLDAQTETFVASTLKANDGKFHENATYILIPIQGIHDSRTKGNGGIGSSGSPMFTLTHDKPHGVVFAFNPQAVGKQTLLGDREQSPAVIEEMSVRKLMPVEVERLQGLPDNWTLVPYRGNPASDTARYRAVGNGWALPCAKFVFAAADRLPLEVSESPREPRRVMDLVGQAGRLEKGERG